jgi:hypothetical protein
VAVRRGEAARRAVQVLAVDLQAVEAPLAERLADERARVVADLVDGRAQVARVPPRDLARRPVRVLQEELGMLAADPRPRVRRERRPPDLRAQSGGVDPVDERLHVGVAARELLRDRPPVALGHLPAVVERRPAEAEPLRERQRRDHLVDGEVAAVAPRAPDRLERARRRGRQLDALFAHHRGVVGERPEVVAGVNGDERAQRLEPLARRERTRVREPDAEGRPVARGPRDGRRHVLRHELEVPDREPDVAAPHVDDRGPAAVVARVHAEEVLLPEADRHREHPVRALLVGAALVGPEGRLPGLRRGLVRRRVDRILPLSPAFDSDRGGSHVRPGRPEDGDIRELVVQDDLDGFLDARGTAGKPVRVSLADRVGDGFLGSGTDDRKVGVLDAAGLQRLRCGEGTELRAFPIQDRDDAGVHARVELELDALARDGERRAAARGRGVTHPGGEGERKREGADANPQGYADDGRLQK